MPTRSTNAKTNSQIPASNCRMRWTNWINKKSFKDQKIAAFGSSYRYTHDSVGAAKGGDLLKINDPETVYDTHYRRLPLFALPAQGCWPDKAEPCWQSPTHRWRLQGCGPFPGSVPAAATQSPWRWCDLPRVPAGNVSTVRGTANRVSPHRRQISAHRTECVHATCHPGLRRS